MHYRGFFTSLILSLAIAASISHAYGAGSKKSILRCLGHEELRIHKKKSEGATYRLNQLFVNELAGLDDVAVKKSFLDKICRKNNNSVAVELLKNLLLHGSKIFDLKLAHVDSEHIKSYKISLTRELENRAPHIFFDYLAQVQGMASTPSCIRDNIPEISYFLERFLYLEADLSSSRLMDDKGKIKNIFSKINQLPKIFKQCEEDKKKSIKK